MKVLATVVATLTLFIASTSLGYAKDFDGVDLKGTIASGGLSMYHSEDDVDLGFRYSKDLPGYTAGASIFYEHTEADANVLGFGLHADRNVWRGVFQLSTDIGWDITNTEFDADTEIRYTVFKIGAYTNLSMDIDDLKYNSTDLGLDYTLKFSDNLSLIPSVEVPFDSSGTRGDATAGLHVKINF